MRLSSGAFPSLKISSHAGRTNRKALAMSAKTSAVTE